MAEVAAAATAEVAAAAAVASKSAAAAGVIRTGWGQKCFQSTAAPTAAVAADLPQEVTRAIRLQTVHPTFAAGRQDREGYHRPLRRGVVVAAATACARNLSYHDRI